MRTECNGIDQHKRETFYSISLERREVIIFWKEPNLFVLNSTPTHISARRSSIGPTEDARGCLFGIATAFGEILYLRRDLDQGEEFESC